MRTKIEVIAQKQNPILKGVMHYYCKFLPAKTRLH